MTLFSTKNKYNKTLKNSNVIEQNTITIAVLIRVSTDMQVEDGDSLEMQMDLANNHAKQIKGLIYKPYVEEGVSARKVRIENRNVIQELMQDIRDGKINYVIAYKRDRMFRNTMEYIGFLQFLADYNVDIYLSASGEQQVDLEAFKFAGASKMMEVVMSMVAEMESATTATRVSDTMLMKAKKGEFTGGSAPIGYTFGKGEYKLELLPRAKETIELVEDLYLEGIGMLSIAKYLNGGKIRGKNQLAEPIPKPIRIEESTVDEWNHKNIHTILFNPIYTGHFSYESKMNPDLDRVIEKSELIEVCRSEVRQKKINDAYEKRKSGTKERVSLNTQFLLSGLVYCSECGERMTVVTSQPKGTKKQFSYYTCRNKRSSRKENCPHNTLYRKEVLEKIIVDIAKDKIQHLIKPDMIETIKLKLEADKFTYTSEADKVKKDIDKLKTKLDNITELVSELDDDLDLQVVYLKKQKVLLHELNDMKEFYSTLEEKSIQDQGEAFNIEEFMELAIKFGHVFDSAPIGVKKQMLDNLFSNIYINKDGEIRMMLKVGLSDIKGDKASDDSASDDLNEVISSIMGRSPVVTEDINGLIKVKQEFDIKINYFDEISKQAKIVSEAFAEFAEQFDKMANPINSSMFLESLTQKQLKRVDNKRKKAETMFKTYFINSYNSSFYIAKNIIEVGYSYAAMCTFLKKHNLQYEDFTDYLVSNYGLDYDEDLIEFILKKRVGKLDKRDKTNTEMLFRSKIICSKCGKIYNRKGGKNVRYICSGRLKSKEFCDTNVSTILESDLLRKITNDVGITDFTEKSIAVLIDHIEIYEDTTFKIIYSN